MVRDEVQDDALAEVVGVRQEGVDVGELPNSGSDVAVVLPS